MNAFALLMLLAALGTGPGGGAAQAAPEGARRAASAGVRMLPPEAVTLQGGFWGPLVERNRTVTIPAVLDLCDATGRTRNFLRAAGRDATPFQGACYDDSDVYKAMEGAFLSLAQHPDPALEARMDRLVADIAAAQEADGYLYTIATTGKRPPEERWKGEIGSHELYNLGHLFEAAVARARTSGKRDLLEVAMRAADLLVATFRPGGRGEAPGHPEVELALVKLAAETGRPQYLALAAYFLAVRGDAATHRLYGPDLQDHAPLEGQREAVGHAVRAAYLWAGAADVAMATGDPRWDDMLDAVWRDVVGRRMHLTGGIGAQPQNEGFGPPYQLPNAGAYLETCAAIANALWNQRQYMRHGDTAPLDVVERILFNGFLAGVSLSGDRFFYPNPLATDGWRRFNHGSRERVPWFACACCPPNVARFLPQIGALGVAWRPGVQGAPDRVDVCQYAQGTATIPLPDGPLLLSQRTEYPWDGQVDLEVQWPQPPGAAAEPRRLTLALRVPGWVRSRPVPSDLYRDFERTELMPRPVPSLNLAVNGAPFPPAFEGGWLLVTRAWSPGDRVSLQLPMEPRRVVAHPAVEADRGLVALERGPLVYCLEAVDQRTESGEPVWLPSAYLPDQAGMESERRPDLPGAPVVLLLEARRRVPADDDDAPARGAEPAFQAVAIPYFLWANRGPGAMEVWIPRSRERAEVPAAPTAASTAEVSASHCWATDAPQAVNDRRRPAGPADQSIARHTWWPHRGTTEWLEYRWREPRTLSRSAVWWFDDTGTGGGCALPARVRLQVRRDGAWIEVAAAAAPGADGRSELRFPETVTDGVRLEVDLQPERSAGVLEWEVE